MSQMRSFRNPVVSGFYPDPSVIRVGEDYFMVNSTFEFFPGVPVLHSRDLVNWRTIGHCLTRKSQLNLDGCPCSRGIWAATIRYHDGLFYVITTIMNPAVHPVPLRKFLVTSTDPAGEWSDPIWIEQPGIDPSLLFDEDGKVYLTSNGGANGQKGINQNLLDVRTGKLLSEDRVIWGGSGGAYPEGPHLYKINGWYYLTIAEGGCQIGHIQTVARSRSPWGPFEAYSKNPILTHRGRGGHVIQGLGHLDWVQDPRGNWWSYCLGYRLNRQFFYHLGRETFLAPMSWTSDGWPVIGNNGTIEIEMLADLPAPHPWPADPIRDDFSGATLGLQWNTLRNAAEGAYSLTDSPGSLTLHGNSASLNDIAAPAFVGRRQCHWDVTVGTELQFAPTRDGDEAGLTIFYQNEYHYEVAVIRSNRQNRLIVRRRVGDLSAVVAEHPAPSGPIVLMLKADKLQYQMGYQLAGEFRLMATGSTQHLSCEAAPVGFTGVYFAMYATGNGQPAQATARFSWFDYEPLVSRDAQRSAAGGVALTWSASLRVAAKWLRHRHLSRFDRFRYGVR